jgi:WD40 repeat protein
VELAGVNRQIRRRTAIGGAVLAGSLVLAAIAGVGAFTASYQKAEAEKKAKTADEQKINAEATAKTAEERTKEANDKLAIAQNQYEKAQEQTKAATAKAGQASRQSQAAQQQVAQANVALEQVNLEKQVMTEAKAAAETAKVAAEQAAQLATANQATANIATVQARQQEQEAKQGVILAQRGFFEAKEVVIASQSEASNMLFSTGQTFDAVLMGLRASQQIQSLENSSSNQTKSKSKWQTITALYQSINRVRERNRLLGYKSRDIMTNPGLIFSPKRNFVAQYDMLNNNGTPRWETRIWSASGEQIRTVDGVLGSFSSDEEFITASDGNIFWKNGLTSNFRVLDTGNGAEIFAPPKNLYAFLYSESEMFALSAVDQKILQIWSLKDRKVIQTLKPEASRIEKVKFSPDYKTIALTSEADKAVEIWNVQTGERLKKIEGLPDDLAYSPDSQVISIQVGKTVQIYHLNQEKQVTLEANLHGVSFSPDSKKIAVINKKNVKIYNIDGVELGAFDADNFNFSPDSRLIALARQQKTVKVWNINTREWQTFIKDDKTVETLSGEHPDFSPDTQTIALKLDSNLIEVWRVGGKSLSQTSGGLFKFSPNSKVIAVYSIADAIIKLVQIGSGEVLDTIIGTQDVYGGYMNFSPDGKIAAVPTGNGVIRLFDIDLENINGRSKVIEKVISPSFDSSETPISEKEIIYPFQSIPITSSPNHNILAKVVIHDPYSTMPASIKLYSKDGAILSTVKLSQGFREKYDVDSGVNSGVAFSSDGEIIVFPYNNVVKIWSITGQEMLNLGDSQSTVLSVQFSPDGKKLLAVDRNGKTVTWDLNLENLKKRGCSWVHDYLMYSPAVSDSDRQMCGISTKPS